MRKDGTQFWANVVITALHDGAGELRRLLEDHQGLDRAEAGGGERPPTWPKKPPPAKWPTQERERLHVTLASIGDAVISTDAEGRVDFLNPVAEELVGWKTEEAAEPDAWRTCSASSTRTPASRSRTRRCGRSRTA